jgi:hypothetical protein
VKVDDVHLTELDGRAVARSKFNEETDTLQVDVDMCKLANGQLAFVVSHEIAHHLAAVLEAPGNVIPGIRDAAQVIAKTEQLRRWLALQAPGSILFDDEIVRKDGNPWVKPRSIIPNVVIRDNRADPDTGLPRNCWVCGKFVKDHVERQPDGRVFCDEHKPADPPMREYAVMLRRPTRQFTTEYISATSAEDAVAKMRKVADDPAHSARWTWDDDDADAVDWVHAELGTDEDGEPDHAEWEPPKLSPGALVKALGDINAMTNVMVHDPLAALAEIRARVAEALIEAVPHD